MYLFHPDSPSLDPLVIPAPSRSTGLFIKTRGGKVVQASIPENCVALQTGETVELLTSRRLAATPHFVNATAASLGRKALQAIERQKEDDPERWGRVDGGKVTRETLAVFLQVRPPSLPARVRSRDDAVADSLSHCAASPTTMRSCRRTVRRLASSRRESSSGTTTTPGRRLLPLPRVAATRRTLLAALPSRPAGVRAGSTRPARCASMPREHAGGPAPRATESIGTRAHCSQSREEMQRKSTSLAAAARLAGPGAGSEAETAPCRQALDSLFTVPRPPLTLGLLCTLGKGTPQEQAQQSHPPTMPASQPGRPPDLGAPVPIPPSLARVRSDAVWDAQGKGKPRHRTPDSSESTQASGPAHHGGGGGDHSTSVRPPLPLLAFARASFTE